MHQTQSELSSHEQLPEQTGFQSQTPFIPANPSWNVKIYAGDEASPHVQLFIKVVLNQPLSRLSGTSCVTIDRGPIPAAVLKVLQLMHPTGAAVIKDPDVQLTTLRNSSAKGCPS